MLLVDPLGRVLLMHGRGWWFAVGGGIDPGETAVQAAIREVREETGISLGVADLGPVVHRSSTVLPWDDGEPLEQHDEFRVARIEAAVPTTAGYTALERATIDGQRWWSVAELRATAERVAPAQLAELLERHAPASAGARLAGA